MRQVKTEGEWSIRETKGDSRTTAGGRPEYEELTEVAAFALGMLGSLYRLDETVRSALDQARRGALKSGLQPGSRKPPASRGFRLYGPATRRQVAIDSWLFVNGCESERFPKHLDWHKVWALG